MVLKKCVKLSLQSIFEVIFNEKLYAYYQNITKEQQIEEIFHNRLIEIFFELSTNGIQDIGD